MHDRSAEPVSDGDPADQQGYVVLIFDPQTGALDAYGPYRGIAATVRADTMRSEFDGDGLRDVIVRICPLFDPR